MKSILYITSSITDTILTFTQTKQPFPLTQTIEASGGNSGLTEFSYTQASEQVSITQEGVRRPGLIRTVGIGEG